MYEVFLPHPDLSVLQQLSGPIKRGMPLPVIMSLCAEASSEVRDAQFPYTYSGILLAKQGRVQDAIQILGRVDGSENPFATQLSRYLSEYGTLQPLVKVFSSPRAYNIWTQTKFYQDYLKATTDHVVQFATENPSPTVHPTILDIGAGNGVLIAEIVNALARRLNLQSVHLILLDPSASMIDSAAAYCRANIRIPVCITTIMGKAEELSTEPLDIMQTKMPIWFINAAASLHHMPHEVKGPTLQKLSALSRLCLITEFEANNDLPDADTPEYVYSVVQHKGYYLDDVLHCGADAEGVKLCIDEFVLAEALVMLSNERAHRIDYHATASQWLNIAERSNYQAVFSKPILRTTEGITLIFMLGLMTCSA